MCSSDLSFSEALAVEVAGSGVTVTALCPGSTATGFAGAAGVQGAALFRSGAMDAATVAQAGYDGAMAGRRVVIPGLMNRVRVLVARLSPRRVSAAIALRLNRTPGSCCERPASVVSSGMTEGEAPLTAVTEGEASEREMT